MTKVLRLLCLTGYVFCAPALAFVSPILAAALFFQAPSTAHNPNTIFSQYDAATRERLVRGLKSFAKEHGTEKICTFDDDLVVATKSIEKGATIEADSISEMKVSSYDQNATAYRALPLTVVGSKAEKRIEPGQLVAVSDIDESDSARQIQKIRDLTGKDSASQFELEIAKQKEARKNDIQKKDVNSAVNKIAGPVLSTSKLLPLLFIAAGAIVCVFSQIGLLVEAFSAHLLWGLAFFTVPFASCVFEIKHWASSSKFVHLTVLGLLIAGCGFISIIASAKPLMSVSEWVEKANQ